MNLKSNCIKVQKSQENLFNFLTKLENFEQLIPQSKQKFEINGDSFLFSLKGMPEIQLNLIEKAPYSEITLGSIGEIKFSLKAKIHKIDNKSSELQLFFQGNFNSMMAMMVKKPIQAFINTLSSNISKLK